jgi:hypothetical protein
MNKKLLTAQKVIVKNEKLELALGKESLISFKSFSVISALLQVNSSMYR